MKILDWYILKRYLATFFVMMLLFIPIGIMVDLAEKFGKMSSRNVPLDEILIYYLNFIVHFSNILFPIFLFLSVIWFTSKLANQTEIVAMLSSGISYNRFLRPYIYGAAFLAGLGFLMSMFIVPYSSKIYNEFYDKYLSSEENAGSKGNNLYNQVSDNEIIYVSEFNSKTNIGKNFSLEYFEGITLKQKINAEQIEWIKNDSSQTYRLTNYVKRIIGEREDILIKEMSKDTLFQFKTDDLLPVEYAAETKNFFELNKFIERERLKGSPNIRLYEMVRYKRWSFMATAFILTFIGVAVSSVKRRGGMGINLAFGVLVGFSYVFFDRIFGILSEKSGLSPLMAVVIPNFIFLILAIILIRQARR
ncbi:LptF/LptG family permease [Capnocytophaga catalasegens]|uniref:Membrane protein n=1 Tax=Capnocytophaga catalasegens TaxID=1004260 RepID=A0AAV5AUI2_9FLAO|nr:LptF/LptG family permease [Capnocytophaga catalasegens]GIZ14126.1 membrane protein [Capnocytophaga catalasegens]GJM49920.1 membrane protein [Capnocytophaga catalasegens]GJM51691.1 membrane protein [Capnocytophaga catalasegens]